MNTWLTTESYPKLIYQMWSLSSTILINKSLQQPVHAHTWILDDKQQLKNLSVPGINGRKEEEQWVKELGMQKKFPGDGEHTQLADELICSLITLLLCQKEAFDAGVPEKLPS